MTDVSTSSGLMRVASGTQLKEADDRALAAAEEIVHEPVMVELASYVRKCWEAARDAKNANSGEMTSTNNRLLSCMRARQGQYEPTKQAQIKEFGGSDIYARIISTKSRTVSAWLKDVLLNANDKPWALDPTPFPEIPGDIVSDIFTLVEAEVQQSAQMGEPMDEKTVRDRVQGLRDQAQEAAVKQAKEAAVRMEVKIEDQFAEGGMRQALRAFIDDIATFPTAILKAPVLRHKRMMRWDDGKPVPTKKIIEEFERVSPFDFFPAPQAESVDDDYCLQRHRMPVKELADMKGVPGYSPEAIDAVLAKYNTTTLHTWADDSVQTERDQLEAKPTHQYSGPNSQITALEFYGSIQGKLLLDWGMDKKDVPKPLDFYDVCIWLVDRWVIKAQLNYDPRGKKPYYTASYEEVPGAFWGNTIYDLIIDCQDVCNATMRALVNNLSISSGPQVAVNTDRLPPDEPISNLHPWKIWQFTSDPLGSSAKAVDFFQPDSNAPELMGVFEKFTLLADDISGIPRYMQGNQKVGGAGRTASGLSMLLDAANKGLKQVISNIDGSVIVPVVESMFVHNMLTDPDPGIKGDISVQARGALALAQKEALQMRRNEFLTATANEMDSQIVGMNGRAAILRETVKGLEMPSDEVIPSNEELMAQQQAQAQAMMMQQGQPDEQMNIQRNADGGMVGISINKANKNTLADGRPITNMFGNNSLRSAS